MARAATVLLLLSILYFSGVTKAATVSGSNDTDFIKDSCKTTLYATVCVETLFAYASKIQHSQYKLAQAALSVSLTKANSTKAYVSRLIKFKGLDKRVYNSIKDCFNEMTDSVESLSDSVEELNNAGSSIGDDFALHMSNVRTWVSAALTNEETCIDEFSGKALDGELKDKIKEQVTNVVQVTSNALAFVNQYASGN